MLEGVGGAAKGAAAAKEAEPQHLLSELPKTRRGAGPTAAAAAAAVPCGAVRATPARTTAAAAAAHVHGRKARKVPRPVGEAK